MSNLNPIGVFDSGVGGLSILAKIRELLPRENLVYVADSAHAPYGARTDSYIQQRCEHIMTFFRTEQVKAVVLACNTATAAAVTRLRQDHHLPIIGMEPALKPAARQSRAGVVGVLATAGTIGSDRFFHLQSQFASEVEIITQPCPGLVEHIEQLVPDRRALRALLVEYIEPLLARGADTLVLGCTHYSLITGLIAEIAGSQVQIMDTGFAVARELQRRLAEQGSLQEGLETGQIRFYSSGSPAQQQALMSHYWGREVKVALLPDTRPVSAA
ncbi:MAG: glutamate racemase [Pseudomonadales bacterium]|nr:glutamate racemase [Pseudomonadales bacterium]